MFLAKKYFGSKEVLKLGNINAKRDWGHAKDYVELQWKMLQKKTPTDYVIATGKSYSVKEFINFCCNYLKFKIIWKGSGLNTKCFLIKSDGSKELLIKIDKKYYRPVDIDYLRGDPSKALRELKFKLRYDIHDLVKDMIDSDIKKLKP